MSDTNTDEIYLKLPNGSTIKFNDEQVHATHEIKKWLKSDRQFFTLAGYAGTGKEQPIDKIVQTPNGPRKIGDLNVGDEIFGVNGDVIYVTGKYPQGIKQAYKVTFRDKTFTECGEDHLWNVWTRKLRANNRGPKTMKTIDIINDGLFYQYGDKKLYKYSIPLCEPVKYPSKDLPLHPYILGVLIGDGSNLGKTPIMTIPDIDKEIVENVESLLPEDMKLSDYRPKGCPRYKFIDSKTYKGNRFNKILKELKLNVKSVDRFIPEIYKYSSIEQRYEILRGLMDTDGTSRGNRISFSTSSTKLCTDIIELVQSLGGVAIKNIDDVRYNNVNHCINIKMFNNPFKLSRKANNWKLSKKNPPSRFIVNIEKSRIVEQVCISVSAKDGLYLTDDYIVTHNTTIIKKIINEFRGRICVSAPTHKAKNVISKTTKMVGVTLHSILGLRPDLNLDDFNPNDPKFNAIAKPNMSGFRLIIIDEASMINTELFKMILKESKKHRHTKILFMGDPAQIPPVNENVSPVFVNDTIQIIELTKVMRQKDGNPLFKVYDSIRGNLNIYDGGIKRVTEFNSKNEGIFFTADKREFRRTLTPFFTSEEFKKNINFTKLIAWRNYTVMESNNLIRNIIYGNTSYHLMVGDVLMAYRTISDKFGMDTIIDNSSDYKVSDVSNRVKNEFNIYGNYVILYDDFNKDSITVFIVDHTDHDNFHLYAEYHDTLKELSYMNKRNWKKYYDFRRKSLIMRSVTEYKNGRSRPNSQIIAKDLDYGFSITAHKSQGSTYEHVFLLETDMFVNPNIYEMNQIKYVGLTRPTTTASVLTQKRFING